MNKNVLNGFRTIFLVLIAIFAAGFVYAGGPGMLDLTFNGTGYKFDGFGGVDDRRYVGMATVLQPDGKIVTAVRGFTGQGQYGVVRYNADGSADLSFGAGGKVQVFFDNSTIAEPGVILLQADGKIVVVGNVINLNRIGIARFNADGTLDPTFDGDGKAIISIQGQNSESICAAIGPDGKLVVGGDIYNTQFPGGFYKAFAARFNMNGSLDTSFDGDGVFITDSIFTAFFVVDVQPDGKIVAGSTYGSGFGLMRLNSDGSIDTSFGSGGFTSTNIGPHGAQLWSLALMADGRIVAGGNAQTASVGGWAFAVARFNADGTLDTSFNGTGKVITSISGNDLLKEIAVQSDGKIVAAGGTNAAVGNIVLVRYNVDGTLDASYGNGGKAVFDLGYNDNAFGLALDPVNNKAIVVGGSYNFFTARITGDYAPLVDVGGRLTDASGRGLAGVQVVLNRSDGTWQYTLTNGFGYYAFHYVSSNEVYLVTLSSKRYVFQPESQSVTLTNTTYDVDFIGSPRSETRSTAFKEEKVTAKPKSGPGLKNKH